MSNNNNSGNFFRFKNVQLVRRPNSGRQTRQNTQITMQGTAEEQFAEIAATAHAEALNDIDDILTDDDSVNYSAPRQQPLEPQVQVQNNNRQVSDSDEANNSTLESATDSSLDTSSIEVIQPNEGLEIRLPINSPQRALPNSPESPRINVAVPIPNDLLTEDEETGDQAMPPTVVPTIPDLKGRRETLSPTPQVPQSVRSAIELTVKDLELSEQCITDKCGEVNFQLSNHRDWNQPNPQLRQDICDLLPILYQSGFNIEGLRIASFTYCLTYCLPSFRLLEPLALTFILRALHNKAFY